MDPIRLIDKYYPPDQASRHVLIVHSSMVAKKALLVADKHPELKLDRDFLYEASMLHDIGIFLTDAPSIYCNGAEPYLMHGFLGANLMRREGYPQHALVCERHTGTGITRDMIVANKIPLPQDRIFVPQTIEEQVICYADKYYSKAHLKKEKSIDKILKTLSRYSKESAAQFQEWLRIFG